jgi:hypothetical protein
MIKRKIKINMKKLLICALLFFLANVPVISFAQTDSLTILIWGEYKKRHTFTIEYNDVILGTFGGDKGHVSIKVPVDSTLQQYQYLPLQILKKRAGSLTATDMIFIYDNRNKFIHIYHPKRWKKNFFLVYYLNVSESVFPIY